MQGNKDNQIFVVTSLEEQTGEKRVERDFGELLKRGAINAMDVSVLKENMENFYNQLLETLDTGRNKIGAFEVEQVEVSAQISGDGKVCLLGSGMEVGVEGGIKFVLKRSKE